VEAKRISRPPYIKCRYVSDYFLGPSMVRGFPLATPYENSQNIFFSNSLYSTHSMYQIQFYRLYSFNLCPIQSLHLSIISTFSHYCRSKLLQKLSEVFIVVFVVCQMSQKGPCLRHVQTHQTSNAGYGVAVTISGTYLATRNTKWTA